MKFEPEIRIGERVFAYVDTQRDGITAIYKDQTSYLRIGDATKIQKDLSLHKKMEKYVFPVAKVLAEGEVGGMAYFVEESLGDKCFGQLFKNENNTVGAVRDVTFDTFFEICAKFAKAQLRTVTQRKDWSDFENGIHLELLYQELPEWKEKIAYKFEKVKECLSVFPFVITHGDFSAFNIYPKGVIDLEDSFMGPAGYDVVNVLEHLNWFPESGDYEFHRVSSCTPQQKMRFFTSMDKIYQQHHLPKISLYVADFDFVKGVWHTVRMRHTPKLQQFRYSLLKSLL